jgi:hypothetical protein
VAGEPGRLPDAQHRPVIPELQHLQVEDLVRLGPDPYRAYTVWSIQPNRALVLHTSDLHSGRALEPADLASGAWLGTWAFVLDQRDDQTTRLVVRLRNQWRPSPVNFLVGLVVTGPAHFVMERKMLKTIKQLVERPAAMPLASELARGAALAAPLRRRLGKHDGCVEHVGESSTGTLRDAARGYVDRPVVTVVLETQGCCGAMPIAWRWRGRPPGSVLATRYVVVRIRRWR